jgi:hypothetical protein
MRRYRVSVGEEFEIRDVKISRDRDRVSEAERLLAEAKHRNLISLVILAMAALFLLGATVLGLEEGNFEKLQTVYNVVAVPFSAIIAYYFGRNRRSDGRDE